MRLLKAQHLRLNRPKPGHCRWPFGKGIRDAYLPTSVQELRNHEAAVIELEQRAKRNYGVQFGRDIV